MPAMHIFFGEMPDIASWPQLVGPEKKLRMPLVCPARTAGATARKSGIPGLGILQVLEREGEFRHVHLQVVRFARAWVPAEG